MKFIKRHYLKKGYEGKYLNIRIHEFKRGILISLIVFFIAIIFLLLFLYSALFSDYLTNPLILLFGKPYMNSISYVYESDDIIQNIASLCGSFDLEENKIKCVNNFVKEFYEYDEHLDETEVFRTPDEIINEGGCCRDYSIFYSSVFELMGFESEFIFKPNHVYLIVYGEENNYTLDQTYFKIQNPNLLKRA